MRLVSVDVYREDVREMLFERGVLVSFYDFDALDREMAAAESAEWKQCVLDTHDARARCLLLKEQGTVYVCATDVEQMRVGKHVAERVCVSHAKGESTDHERVYFIVSYRGEARFCAFDDIEEAVRGV